MEKKICSACGQEKDLSHFTKIKGTDRYRYKCHECRRLDYQRAPEKTLARSTSYYYEHREEVLQKAKNRRRANKAKEMWKSARERARKKDVPFAIDVEDIVIPDFCPVLGIPLVVGDGVLHSNSPSLDRIVPEKGYVKGNVIVVSHKANTIKSDANIDELRKVVAFYENLL